MLFFVSTYLTFDKLAPGTVEQLKGNDPLARSIFFKTKLNVIWCVLPIPRSAIILVALWASGPSHCLKTDKGSICAPALKNDWFSSWWFFEIKTLACLGIIVSRMNAEYISKVYSSNIKLARLVPWFMSVDRNMPTSQQMFVVWGVVRHQWWPRFWARAHGWGRRRIPVHLIGSKFQIGFLHSKTRVKNKKVQTVFSCAEKLLFDLLHTELMPGVPYFPFWQQWGGLGRICRRWLIRVHLFNVRISFRINFLHFVSEGFMQITIISLQANHLGSPVSVTCSLWLIQDTCINLMCTRDYLWGLKKIPYHIRKGIGGVLEETTIICT